MKDVVLIIPSLDPGKEFVEIIKKAHEKLENIIVVNDGSSKEYNSIFESIEKEGVVVLYHDKNHGKGRALKTAYQYVLNNFKKARVVVTADSDGQHEIDDIIKCAKMALDNPNDLILGVRDFDNKNVPTKNKMGNKITRNVMQWLYGTFISDTQTGLRAFDINNMSILMNSSGERFEYETNVLIDAVTNNIRIREVSIKTIYDKHDYKTHFNPLKDSFKIYSLFGKEIILSFIAFVIGILAFWITYGYFDDIALSLVLAKTITMLYNWAMLPRKRNGEYYKIQLFNLVVSVIILSLAGNYININVVWLKVIYDVIYFILSFLSKVF